MGCSSLPSVGYKQQTYQVSCLGCQHDDPGARVVIGWTEDPTGGELVRMIEKHPVWNSPEVSEVKK